MGTLRGPEGIASTHSSSWQGAGGDGKDRILSERTRGAEHAGQGVPRHRYKVLSAWGETIRVTADGGGAGRWEQITSVSSLTSVPSGERERTRNRSTNS